MAWIDWPNEKSEECRVVKKIVGPIKFWSQ
jgi:hypothetical protein